MTEPCLNNPCMMTFKAYCKSLLNKVLQTWMKLFSFRLNYLRISNWKKKKVTLLHIWAVQNKKERLQRLLQPFPYRLRFLLSGHYFETTVIASHKHLYPSEPVLKHNCLRCCCLSSSSWMKDSLGMNRVTPSLFQVLLSMPEAESQPGNHTKVSTVFKLLSFLRQRSLCRWVLSKLETQNVKQKHV